MEYGPVLSRTLPVDQWLKQPIDAREIMVVYHVQNISENLG